MSRALATSAAAGAVIMNSMYMLSEVPTARSAWGWQMSAPADAHFTCAEGQIGCPSMPPVCNASVPGGCCASNFTCTVTPKSGKTCDVTTIDLKCSKNGGAASQPNVIACINLGYGNISVDSNLSWSATPVCTDAPATAASGADALGVGVSSLVTLVVAAVTV
eukprot:TRINITY_DN796_c0_g3_i1.p1 TRINITY_DN796_c0_g3~~TRINITY_DN796_c0_g3_i1.p1  ORF type:complete len:163 (+),score=29.71 TRINITY_DN796_c0_g3_i1:77-565(+)